MPLKVEGSRYSAIKLEEEEAIVGTKMGTSADDGQVVGSRRGGGSKKSLPSLFARTNKSGKDRKDKNKKSKDKNKKMLVPSTSSNNNNNVGKRMIMAISTRSSSTNTSSSVASTASVSPSRSVSTAALSETPESSPVAVVQDKSQQLSTVSFPTLPHPSSSFREKHRRFRNKKKPDSVR